jgi:hypothetical protein
VAECSSNCRAEWTADDGAEAATDGTANELRGVVGLVVLRVAHLLRLLRALVWRGWKC